MLVVDTSKMPAMVVTVLRYLATLLGGWMVRHGYMGADDTQLLGGALLGLAALVWGVYDTFRHKKQIEAAAITPPDNVVLK